VSGVLDNILHLSPLWLLGTAVLSVFLEDAIFIGFLVPGETAAVGAQWELRCPVARADQWFRRRSRALQVIRLLPRHG